MSESENVQDKRHYTFQGVIATPGWEIVLEGEHPHPLLVVEVENFLGYKMENDLPTGRVVIPISTYPVNNDLILEESLGTKVQWVTFFISDQGDSVGIPAEDWRRILYEPEYFTGQGENPVGAYVIR